MDTIRKREDMTVLCVARDEGLRQRLAELLGRLSGEVIESGHGRLALQLFHESHPDVVLADMADPAAGCTQLISAVRRIRPDVPVLAVADVGQPDLLRTAAGLGVDAILPNPLYPDLVIDAFERAAERVEQRRTSRRAAQFVQSLLNTYPAFVLLTEAGGAPFMNTKFLEYLGFESMDAFRRSGLSLGDYIVRLDGEPYDHGASDWIETVVGDPLDRDHVLHITNPKHPDRTPSPFMAAYRAFATPGQYLVTLSNVSEFELERLELRSEAETDPLTRLLNRRAFLDRLDELLRLADVQRTPLAAIMFDLDHFKSVNDSYGHDAGDEVLREASSLARREVRDDDLLCRWGGEEFLVLLPRADLAEARAVAERVRSGFESHEFSAVPRAVTASFGIAELERRESAEDLLRRADEALYLAKHHGRNRVYPGGDGE